jgi:hypothetical protein
MSGNLSRVVRPYALPEVAPPKVVVEGGRKVVRPIPVIIGATLIPLNPTFGPGPHFAVDHESPGTLVRPGPGVVVLPFGARVVADPFLGPGLFYVQGGGGGKTLSGSVSISVRSYMRKVIKETVDNPNA